MIFARHGNIDGPSDMANTMPQFRKALNKGYGLEIDVWGVRGDLWIGHDSPFYPSSRHAIQTMSDYEPILLDCKNYEAMVWATKNFCGPRIDAYYYSPDHPVFSMFGRLIIPPTFSPPSHNVSRVYVMPEDSSWSIKPNEIISLVTDYPGKYK